MADVEIKGLSELVAALRELPKAVEQKVLRQSMVPGAQLIRQTAKDIHRSKVGFWTSGLTEKAIRIGFNKKESTQGKAVYHIFVSMNVRGPRRYRGSTRFMGISFKNAKVSNVNWPPFWWRYLEFGTSKMAARPFMRPAFDVSSQQALSVITNKLDSGIQKEAARLGKS